MEWTGCQGRPVPKAMTSGFSTATLPPGSLSFPLHSHRSVCAPLHTTAVCPPTRGTSHIRWSEDWCAQTWPPVSSGHLEILKETWLGIPTGARRGIWMSKTSLVWDKRAWRNCVIYYRWEDPCSQTSEDDRHKKHTGTTTSSVMKEWESWLGSWKTCLRKWRSVCRAEISRKHGLELQHEWEEGSWQRKSQENAKDGWHLGPKPGPGVWGHICLIKGNKFYSMSSGDPLEDL